jgi:hypothetical protein
MDASIEQIKTDVMEAVEPDEDWRPGGKDEELRH